MENISENTKQYLLDLDSSVADLFDIFGFDSGIENVVHIVKD